MKKILTLLSLALIIQVSLASEKQNIKNAKGLKVGTKAPLFIGTDGNENEFNLESELNKGPVVLFFYRGAWCPYCNRHLTELQKSLPKLYEKGVSVHK